VDWHYIAPGKPTYQQDDFSGNFPFSPQATSFRWMIFSLAALSRRNPTCARDDAVVRT
jgi:hypothetical protein